MTAPIPSYGHRSLAGVMPGILAALGVPTKDELADGGLTIAPLRAAGLLLVDGLGERLLRRYAADAPFLAALPDLGPVTVGFPSSTSIGLATLSTAVPPGQHGIVGIAMRPDGENMLDTLQWKRHGEGPHVDLREVLVPEQLQEMPTTWERAAAAGIATTTIAPRTFKGSGLTRATLRGGDYEGTLAAGDLVAGVIAALSRGGRQLCYAYHSDLDTLGHVHAPGSVQWRMQLRLIDRMVAMIAEALPPDAALFITGDHGMVTVTDRIDFDELPRLRDGVEALGGDPRSRHVYCRPGAEADVLAAWRETLGDRGWVLPADEAIAAGLFGSVRSAVRPRIGDVVAAMTGTAIVTRSRVEKFLSRLPGQHGSLTADEQLVPVLVAGGDR